MNTQMELSPEIIKALNRKRGELNLTKKQLAKVLDIGESTIYRWSNQTPPFKIQTKMYVKVMNWIVENS